MSRLVVLGATGSIGRQTLDVASHLDLEVGAIAARRGSDELLALSKAYPDALIGVAGPTPAERDRFAHDLGDRVRFGPETLVEFASLEQSIVVNGTVGAAGLPASVAALEAGNRLALANKESLVAGGPVVEAARIAGGGELVPVDSEHSALAQLLDGEDRASVRRLVLPASGGPFRGWDQARIAAATPEQALAHPTWNMGARISIDSASLMNKAFEVIEAHWLFGMPYDQIDVVVHPQSLVHGLVEFEDGSVTAHVGEPDMRVPIQYAITYPKRAVGQAEQFSLAGRSLTFEAPDLDAFPSLAIGYAAGRAGGSAPAVLNAADEVAVQAFLEGRIGFSSIPAVVERTLEEMAVVDVATVDEVLEVDREARAVAHTHTGASC